MRLELLDVVTFSFRMLDLHWAHQENDLFLEQPYS